MRESRKRALRNKEIALRHFFPVLYLKTEKTFLGLFDIIHMEHRSTH